jgi:CheY-like chemotaxis protein
MNVGNAALVIDDSPSIREYVRAVLKDELHFSQVQLACCADEGIDLLKADNDQHIGLVVCDWEMPGSEAGRLFEYVRQHYDPSRMSLVLITGRKDNLARQLAEQVKADDYLSKPFTSGLFVSKIRGLMGLDERRRAERIAPQLSCSLDLSFDRETWLDTELVNISETGCLLKMPIINGGHAHVYDIGSIKFTFQDGSFLVLDGHIVRIERDKHSVENQRKVFVAFEYLFMDPMKKQGLLTYLKHCLTRTDDAAEMAG